MSARAASILALVVAVCAGACARREITVIEASYGGRCGAPQGNVTGAVANACDGTRGCTFVVDVAQLGDPAAGCAKDFRVVWRCATEEGIRTAAVTEDAGNGSSVALHCSAPVARRIDVLAATAGAVPVRGLTAAVVERCAGRTSCTVALEQLAPLRQVARDTAAARIHWRCEGEMTKREAAVSASSTARLSCE